MMSLIEKLLAPMQSSQKQAPIAVSLLSARGGVTVDHTPTIAKQDAALDHLTNKFVDAASDLAADAGLHAGTGDGLVVSEDMLDGL